MMVQIHPSGSQGALVYWENMSFSSSRERIVTAMRYMKTNKEICICAAVKTTSGRIIRGHRHGDCIKAIIARGLKPSGSIDAQGFITSKNRYVTREVGRKLQDAAGIPSASPEGYMPGTLFSEDLY